MSVLLDAFALIALMLDEPAAGEVEMLLRRGDAVVTAVGLAETADVLARVHKQDPAAIRDAIRPHLAEAVSVLSIGEDVAWRAAELRARHYRRRSSELSLADCLLLAAAGPGDSLATADPPLARATRAEGVKVTPLPDERGQRP